MDEEVKLEVRDLIPLLTLAEQENLQLKMAVNALRRLLAEAQAEVARYANGPADDPEDKGSE